MEIYKEINKTLINSIQDLKIQNSALQREIITMRGVIMDDHVKRVTFHKEIKRMLIDNFSKLMKFLEPESNLLDVLQAEADDECIGFGQAPPPRRLHKAEILKELRRSNSLQRRSSIDSSPTRRSSSAMSIASEENEIPITEMESVIPKRRADEKIVSMEISYGNVTLADSSSAEEPEDCESNDDEDNEASEGTVNKVKEGTLDLGDSSQKTVKLPNISEEEFQSHEEESQEYNDLQKDELNEKEEVYKSPKQASDAQKTLKNCPSLRAMKHKHQNGIAVQDVSNVTQIAEDEKSPPKTPLRHKIPNVVARRCKQRSSLASDECIVTARNAISQQDEIRLNDETLALGGDVAKERERNCCCQHREIAATSLEIAAASIAFAEVTIGQFTEDLSSTPNMTATEEAQATERQSTRAWATRSCRPKCLTERNLQKKLRNETNMKFRIYSRKKK